MTSEVCAEGYPSTYSKSVYDADYAVRIDVSSTLRVTHIANTLRAMNYGQRIREIRLAQGKTLLEVAIDADMNNGNLSKIERGLEQASIETLTNIALALGVHIKDLFEEAGSDLTSAPRATLVPVIGEARLGTLGNYEASQYPQGGDGWVKCAVESSGAFALRCTGNSMRPKILPRQFVVIEPNKKPQIDDAVAVRTRDGRQMIKVLAQRHDGFIRLTSYNEDFAPEDLQEHEVLEMYRVDNVYPPDAHIPRTDG